MQVWLPNTKQAEVGDKVCVELGARGMPVSYTHLDVYKRQALSIINHRVDGKK